MRRWLIATVLLFILSACGDAYGHHEEFERLARALLQDEHVEEIDVLALTDFAWDRSYAFAPYTTREFVRETLGANFDKVGSFGVPESEYLFVFMNQGDIVQYAYVDARRGFLVNNDEAVTPENAKIRIGRWSESMVRENNFIGAQIYEYSVSKAQLIPEDFYSKAEFLERLRVIDAAEETVALEAIDDRKTRYIQLQFGDPSSIRLYEHYFYVTDHAGNGYIKRFEFVGDLSFGSDEPEEIRSLMERVGSDDWLAVGSAFFDMISSPAGMNRQS